jgi:acetylornithine deacetylase/succinyl-diaminopimelate desuccinylase-like protein
MVKPETITRYTNYALQQIHTICDQFGPRIAGSSAEDATTLYLESELKKYADEVVHTEFSVYPTFYPQGIVKITGFCYLLAIISFFFSGHYALISVGFFLFGTFILFVSLGLMKTWFTFGFPQATSHNILGKIKPHSYYSNEPPKESIPVILIAGHTDSAYEMPISRYGFIFLLLIALYMILMFLLGILKLILSSIPESDLISPVFSIGFVSFTPLDLIGFILSLMGLPIFFKTILGLINGYPVMGANDNLSGVGISLALAKYFSEPQHRLHHTELWVGSFGSEECGERGAKYFIDTNLENLQSRPVQAVIPDSVGSGTRIVIVSKEFMHFATHNITVCQGLLQAYQENQTNHVISDNIPCDIEVLPFGASDAGRFAHAGFNSASIIALDDTNQPPNYHLRTDLPSHINLAILKTVFALYVNYLQNFDRKFT